jgi:GNAT superfamily N-acetyltransferase
MGPIAAVVPVTIAAAEAARLWEGSRQMDRPLTGSTVSGVRMGGDITLRRADRRDLPVLGRLGATLVRVHHAFDSDRFLAPQGDVEEGYAWFLATQLDDPDVVIFVAERSGQPVGYVYAGLEPMSWKELRGPAGFIHDVVVDASARGRGIGRALVEQAATWLEERGSPRVMLWTAAQNAGARQLFSKLGFRPTMVEMTRERQSPPGPANPAVDGER